MADKRGLAPSSLALPNLDSVIVAARDDAEPISVDGPHALDVAKERPEGLTRLDVPHLDGVVERAGEKDGRGVRERGRSRIGMRCENGAARVLPAAGGGRGRRAASVCIVVAERADCGW